MKDLTPGFGIGGFYHWFRRMRRLTGSGWGKIERLREYPFQFVLSPPDCGLDIRAVRRTQEKGGALGKFEQKTSPCLGFCLLYALRQIFRLRFEGPGCD